MIVILRIIPTTLQDLACAVLGNLFCDPEASAGAELAGQAAEFSLLGGSAADKLLVGFVQTDKTDHRLVHACTSYKNPGATMTLGGAKQRHAQRIPFN